MYVYIYMYVCIYTYIYRETWRRRGRSSNTGDKAGDAILSAPPRVDTATVSDSQGMGEASSHVPHRLAD
jgi:hypothetical protein